MPPRPRLGSWWFLVATAGGAALAVLLDPHGWSQERRLRAQVSLMRAQNRQLELEIARAGREARALRGDPAALERAAREQLRFVRPGEIVYRLDAGPGSAP